MNPYTLVAKLGGARVYDSEVHACGRRASYVVLVAALDDAVRAMERIQVTAENQERADRAWNAEVAHLRFLADQWR